MTNMHGVPDPTKYKFISDDGKREFSVEEYVAIVDDPKRTQPIPMAVPRDPTDPAHVAMVARHAPKRTAAALPTVPTVPPPGRVALAESPTNWDEPTNWDDPRCTHPGCAKQVYARAFDGRCWVHTDDWQSGPYRLDARLPTTSPYHDASSPHLSVRLAAPSIEVATVASIASPLKTRTATPTMPSAESINARLDVLEKDIAARRDAELAALAAKHEAAGMTSIDALIQASCERPDLAGGYAAVAKPVLTSAEEVAIAAAAWAAEDEREALRTAKGSPDRKDLVTRAYIDKAERDAAYQQAIQDAQREFPTFDLAQISQLVHELMPELSELSDAEKELAGDRDRDAADYYAEQPNH